MRRTRIVFLLAALSGCSATPTPRATSEADSLVLERTGCFGTCPAYRLSLTAAGRVDFRSRGGDATHESGNVSQATLAALVQRAEAFGFFALPDRLQRGSPLCADWATDHPTVMVTIYRASGAKAVMDYHGCFSRSDHSVVDVVRQLRDFERAVDSATGSNRWVRPASRR
jgi:Domain of unknown function (DUF6438)